MEITKLLKEEFKLKPNTKYAAAYFKSLGYKKNLNEKKTIARANAIESLFINTDKQIYKNDLIVGSISGLWKDVDIRLLNSAIAVDKSFGSRHFGQNFDHYSPNYQNLIDRGVNGILEDIENSLKNNKEDKEKAIFLESMKISLNAFRGLILGYSEKAKTLLNDKSYNISYLKQIIDNCEYIADNKPSTYMQGLQLVWLCHISFCLEERYAMALGRIDQYLYPLYKKDLENKSITYERAVELLENVFIKIGENRALKNCDDVVNICIGGLNVNGEDAVNELSYATLEAVKNCNIPGPNLSARISKKTPDKFLDECLKVIGTGLGYPALMNDEINIKALENYGYEKQDVLNYTMVGCIENFITGKQPPWSDGRFDTPRFFEYVFNEGKGILNEGFGIDTGKLEDIKSMPEFIKKLELQLENGVNEYVAFTYNENTRVNPKEYTQPFLSIFCDNCIERGKDICDGGSKYPSVHGAAIMGVGTMCDSLAAIEKVVFIDKKATLEDIKNAIINNFKGYENLENLLKDAPKYGNNNSFVDKYSIWFVEYLSKLFSKYKTYDGGGIYIAMAANVSNIYAGKTISATPDGRKAGEPLSDAASPTYGKDTKGATSTILSVTNPDYTKVACGTVINQKFSPNMFTVDKNREKLLSLIRVYFAKGGQEMQINATSREVLIDAMKNPDKYQNLVVRVSGFSAFYITLDKDVQLDILNRTQQN